MSCEVSQTYCTKKKKKNVMEEAGNEKKKYCAGV